MKRRGNNEGSVYKIEKRNGWVGMATVGRDATGKVLRKAVSGKTRAEAVTKMNKLIAANQNRKVIATLTKRQIDAIKLLLSEGVIAAINQAVDQAFSQNIIEIPKGGVK
jgi:hypothetical protein